jgi:hypothetical protein
MENELINRVLRENRPIFQKEGLSETAAISKLKDILNNLNGNIYIEKGGNPFQVKEMNNLLQVKLGYYKILGNANPEEYVKRCTLTPTSKGINILYEYRRFISD